MPSLRTFSSHRLNRSNKSGGCSCGTKRASSETGSGSTPISTTSTSSSSESKCGCASKKEEAKCCSSNGSSKKEEAKCCLSNGSSKKEEAKCCSSNGSSKKEEAKCCLSNGPSKKEETAGSCCPAPVGGNDSLVISADPEHPANLICEICKMFYNNGWVTGTGGGISIRDDDHIYLAPSGVQKERMVPDNLFVMSFKSKEYIRKPLALKPSACTPLFMASYTIRNAGSCLHTHSQNAVMCTLLFDKVFEISSIEQIKALPKITEAGNMWYSDKLVIPIIENTEKEEELESSLRKAIEEYPSTTAVLVRRHGIYVWGETVWKAKIYNEAIDYLLELAIKMKQMGIPTVKEATK